MYYYFPIVVFYAVFGIGAGVRYIHYIIIGKKRKYDDLIAPTAQSLWNVIISFTVIGLIIYFVSKYDKRLENRHPPIEILMNKKN